MSSKSAQVRKKFEAISQRKSNAYLNPKPAQEKKETSFVKNKHKKKPKEKSDMSEKFRKDLIQKATKSELAFKKFLDNQMVAYQFQKVIWVSVDCEQKFYIADFFFKRYNLIVELDGGYHYTDEQKKADDVRTMHLRRAGYFVLRFDNSATDNSKDIYNEIIDFIEEKFGKI